MFMSFNTELYDWAFTFFEGIQHRSPLIKATLIEWGYKTNNKF